MAAVDAQKTMKTSNGINGRTKGTQSDSTPPNAWQTPGPAAFDFRSDVVTTPTPTMLHAITQTTLLDDVFHEDPTTLALESLLSALTSHPSALLVLSGTMGNQVALRTHLTQPPHSVLTDHRSHIVEWEAGGVASLCGAMVKGLIPRNGHHLTLAEDILPNAVVSDEDVHSTPTRVISLENTLGGEILPLDECRRISVWARAQSPPIKMHLDGARLWEAVSAQCAAASITTRGEAEPEPETESQNNGGRDSLIERLKDYCTLFDSVSLCFSKGLGAPIGSILVGDEAFIRKARHIRKSIGGGLRQAGVVTAAARVSVEETFLGGKLARSHERAREIARLWEGKGGKLARGVETNMVWLDLEAVECGVKEFVEVGVRYGVKLYGGRLVVHYQISNDAVRKLEQVMDEVLDPKSDRNRNTKGKKTPSGEEKAEAERIMAPEME
ncbi:hypothetical protein MMC24_002202 [Lignoscripta atroalba]|nr:hypothetical protein [Lignoscripta atroalba]